MLLDSSTIYDRLMAAADACDPGHLTYEDRAVNGLARSRDRAASLRHLADLAREHCRSAVIEVAQPKPATKPKAKWTAPKCRLVADLMKQEVAEVIADDAERAVALTAKQIIAQVALKHRISVDELKAAGRRPHVVLARHEAMWRLAKEKPFSYPQIAKMVGRKDHSSVWHGVRKHQARLDAEEG